MNQEIQKASNYAFRLLKYRQRSTKEIRDRLKRKNFPAGIIESVINDLCENRFLDDPAFACAWIDYRLKNKIGLRRIRMELTALGISKEITEKQLIAIKNDYNEEETIEEIIKQKMQKIKTPVDLTLKRRIYSFLLRRGFTPDLVSERIKQL